MKSVGVYEAKTHLAALLDEVSSGACITITRHGVPVAELVPVARHPRAAIRDAIQATKEMRRGCSLDGLTTRDLIEEGRR